MTDNVTHMYQPLAQEDWKFIFDVLEGTKLDVPRIRSEVARLYRDANKSERRAISFGDIMSQHISAMRAAVVAGHLESPAHGLQWIVNTLIGPGHLPDLEEARALGGAQALFDKEMAEHEAFRAAHPAPEA